MTRFWVASIVLLLSGASASAGQRSDHFGLSYYDRETGLSVALETGQHGDYLRVGHDGRYVRHDDRRYRDHRHERRYRYRHHDHHRRHEHRYYRDHYYRDHHNRHYRNSYYRDRHYRRGDRHYRYGHRHDRYCRH